MADNVPQIAKAFTWVFLMKDATDGHTPEPGKSPTVTVSKDGAAFGALSGSPAVSEIGSGWYKVTVAAADMAATTILKAAASGCVDTSERFYLGNWMAWLVNKKVINRTTGEISVKQADGTTEQFKYTYGNVDNDNYSLTPS